jgi:putative OPT family oligopeptide transporter
MVTTSDLPYPEGVAAAEVLQVGSRAREATGAGANPEVREGLVAVVYGTIASAALAILIATRVAAGNVADFFRLPNGAATGYDLGFSLALLGAGYLVGLSVGMAMLTGLVIAWGGAVPILTTMNPAPDGVDFATHCGAPTCASSAPVLSPSPRSGPC